MRQHFHRFVCAFAIALTAAQVAGATQITINGMVGATQYLNHLPPDHEVDVIGAFQTSASTTVAGDPTVDIKYNQAEPMKPITLVLSSFIAANWHLNIDPQANVERIVLNGSGAQTVSGTGSIPVSIYTGQNWLGAYAYMWPMNTGGSNTQKLLANLESLLQTRIASYTGAYQASSFTVTGSPLSQQIVNPLLGAGNLTDGSNPDLIYNKLTGDVKIDLSDLAARYPNQFNQQFSTQQLFVSLANHDGTFSVANFRSTDFGQLGSGSPVLNSNRLGYQNVSMGGWHGQLLDLGSILPIGISDAATLRQYFAAAAFQTNNERGDFDLTVVPEPGAFALFGAGLLLLGVVAGNHSRRPGRINRWLKLSGYTMVVLLSATASYATTVSVIGVSGLTSYQNHLPPDSEIHVIGIGGDSSGSGSPVLFVKYTGTEPMKPITLVLSSYWANFWQIHIDPLAKVDRIVLSGYEKQTYTLIGLGSAPVTSYSFAEGNYLGFSPAAWPLDDSQNFLVTVEDLYHTRISSFTGATQGGTWTITGSPASVQTVNPLLGAGNLSDGSNPDLIYNKLTGNLTIDLSDLAAKYPQGPNGFQQSFTSQSLAISLANQDSSFNVANFNAADLTALAPFPTGPDINDNRLGYSSSLGGWHGQLLNLGNIIPTGISDTAALRQYLAAAAFSTNFEHGDFDLIVIPEPGSLSLLCVGALLLAVTARRHRSVLTAI